MLGHCLPPAPCPGPCQQVVSQDLFNKYPHPETQCKGVYTEGDFLLHFAGEQLGAGEKGGGSAKEASLGESSLTGPLA